MYTTACERCRKMRMKCIRPSRGQDQAEICERCKEDATECITRKRRVGRQVGVKNRKTKALKLQEQDARNALALGLGMDLDREGGTVVRDVDHLPNPLHVLASEAVRRQPTPPPESDVTVQTSDGNRFTSVCSSEAILDHYAEWSSKIHPSLGRQMLRDRLNTLLSSEPDESLLVFDEPAVFGGRVDMARPDPSEHDPISLQVLSLPEAQHLFDSFMNLVTNGSMHFDLRLHTLSWVRSRSPFLLTVILALASTYRSLCSSSLLHAQLMNHAARLESSIRNNHYKSIEIVQAFLLLANWSEVPHTLCRDKSWSFVSHAIALAVELRLDTPLPYCVQTDPMYDAAHHDRLVRNAHRTCLLLYIHDRNMAMVAGRYPIFPESNLTSQPSLDQWGKHPIACKYDAPVTASVSLRKLVIEVHHKMATRRLSDFAADKEVTDRAIAEWRIKWHKETQGTLEYDIIAKFSTFVLTLTLLKKGNYVNGMGAEARKACEALAFEVCCTSIRHYTSWTGLLNSASFDTSMVAFCAIYTIQAINRSNTGHLSDWSLFRLATLQALASEFETQAKARHQVDRENSMSVVDAMARQLSRGVRVVLNKKTMGRSLCSATNSLPELRQSMIGQPFDIDHPSNHDQTHVEYPSHDHGHVHDHHPQAQTSSGSGLEPQHLDELNQLMFANNAISFIPQWTLDSLVPTTSYSWENDVIQDWSGMSSEPMFDLNGTSMDFLPEGS